MTPRLGGPCLPEVRAATEKLYAVSGDNPVMTRLSVAGEERAESFTLELLASEYWIRYRVMIPFL